MTSTIADEATHHHPDGPPALHLSDMTMAFGVNKVLKGVDMSLKRGTITALLGANGAGKSTLIKVLSGVYPQQDGVIEIDGNPVDITAPTVANEYGIQTVHQRIDDAIVPGLTVAENLLFEEIVRGEAPKMSSLSTMLPRAREIADLLDLGWSDTVLRQDVYELGIADCQLLLLARALVSQPKVFILDEPTSTLSASEANRLFELVLKLKDEGVAILYVSHRLGEINHLADEVAVLRDGRIVDRQERPFNFGQAIRSMLGEGVLTDAESIVERHGTEDALILNDVQLLPHSKPIDFTLRSGEVTGVIGLIGAGKTEMAERIFGAVRLKQGSMTLKGREYQPNHPKDAVRKGVYLVPEDRAADAMLPAWGIAQTLSLPFLSRITRSALLDFSQERKQAEEVITDFGVVATSGGQALDALSGGNQQKVVVARWMRTDPTVLILDEPYRGVDIGARRAISHKAREQADAGASVLVLVSDVDELREVADRIVVLVEGEITLDAYTSQVSNDQIIASMSEVS